MWNVTGRQVVRLMKADLMKHTSLLAFVAALTVASPALGQDAAPPVASGQVERKESAKPAEEQPEPPTEDGGKQESKPAKKASKKAIEGDWGFRWTDHPSLRLGQGTRVDFRARWQGNIQNLDVQLPDGEASSTLDIARRRVGIDGEILNIFDYELESELGVKRDPWRDVYLNYKQYGFAQVQFGKFKVPFSLDENTSATNLDFVYRSRIASLLAPGRDLGVMVHGRVLHRGWLRYELGAFNEDGSNVRTYDTDRVHGERTLAGRAVVQPFRSTKSLASDLALGVAFTRSELPEGVSDLRGRTELDAAFYRPGIIVNGQRQRIGFEARWRPGPFSIKSEYIRLTDERLGESVENTDLEPFVSAGWYVSGTWALTGEKKADGLDAPLRPLFRGGFGAVELALRVERIRFGTTGDDLLASDAPRSEVILGNADRAITFGVNWYVNRWIKIQTNLVRNTIALPEQGPLPSQPVFWSRIVRFQFSM
jgi:phosphate-selective porin